MSERLDPAEFIITRKRKKYRFALFANSPLCFEFDEWDNAWKADTIEIGAGTGLFSVALAQAHPDRRFVAIDVKGDRLQTGAKLAEEKGLTNIRFLRARADQITQVFQSQSLSAIWLTFSDPFPKKRSAGRRLTHPNFLVLYRELLTANGALYIKHDNKAFFEWSLEQLVSARWHIAELSFDLHESLLLDEYKVMTTYEKRWMAEGLTTNFVKATRPVDYLVASR